MSREELQAIVEQLTDTMDAYRAHRQWQPAKNDRDENEETYQRQLGMLAFLLEEAGLGK